MMLLAPTDTCFCSRTWYSWRGTSDSDCALRRLSMVSGVSMPLGSDDAMPEVRPDTMPDMTPVAMPDAMPSATSWSG